MRRDRRRDRPVDRRDDGGGECAGRALHASPRFPDGGPHIVAHPRGRDPRRQPERPDRRPHKSARYRGHPGDVFRMGWRGSADPGQARRRRARRIHGSVVRQSVQPLGSERTPPPDRGGVPRVGPAQVGPAGSGALRRRPRPDARLWKRGLGRANPCLLVCARRLFRRLRRPRSHDEHRHRLTARWHDLHPQRHVGDRARRGQARPGPGRYYGPERRGFRADAGARGPHPDRHRPQPGAGHPGRAACAGRDGRRPGTAAPRASNPTQGAGWMSAQATGMRSGRWSVLQGQLRDGPSLVLVGVLLLLVFVIGVPRPGPVGPTGVANTILFAAPLGIVAAGQPLVMLTAGIDLSVAAVMTAAAYVAASQSYFGSIRAVILALAVGLVVGLLNGIGVAIFPGPPLIITLGMGLVASGVLLVYRLKVSPEGPPNVPDIVRTLGSGKVLGFVPNSAPLWGAIATIVIVGLRQTGYGRLIYAIGDNPVACRLAGVRGWLVQLVTYVICGFLAAVAGLVLTGAINGADLSLGDVYLLPSVAAVVIGGASIYGGDGGCWGAPFRAAGPL